MYTITIKNKEGKNKDKKKSGTYQSTTPERKSKLAKACKVKSIKLFIYPTIKTLSLQGRNMETLKKMLLAEYEEDSKKLDSRIIQYLDIYLCNYATELKQKQFKEGTISKEKITGIIKKKVLKEKNKGLNEDLQKIGNVEKAEAPQYINISVEWRNCRTYGNLSAHANIIINGLSFTGFASGYGYDRESTAIADALNKSFSALKVLYTKKNNAFDKTNHQLLGYGSGYGVLPYFEGGVGTKCLLALFEKAGYKLITESHGKRFDCYNLKLESVEK